ncbi:MAG TPA: DMT family transporter [Spirochaetia bacterium]|nr:DMT family transporter [Spirochaetia bacterium]
MAIVLAALSAALYGSADFAGGLATRSNPVHAVLVVSQIAGTVVAAAALPLIAAGAPTGTELIWGAAAGLGGAVGLIALYRGIATTVVAVVSPTSALVGAVLPVVFGVISGERPSTAAWVGIALCLPALFLLTFEPQKEARDAVRRALVAGIIAGAGFGWFFIAISRPAAAAGLWPLLAARCTSIVAVAAVSLALGWSLRVHIRSIPVVVIAGVCDMGANVAFILSTRGTLLALATVVTSLFPAPTVLLARIFFHEQVTRARLAGVALAVTGVALIGLA